MDDAISFDDWLPVAEEWSDWGMLINEKPALAPVYRLAERDKSNGPKCTLVDGDSIRFSRIVVRVGYEFGVHSITKTEWWQTGLELTAKKTGLSPEDIKKVILALYLTSPFKRVSRDIYEEKIRPLTRQGQLRNVRAMWFYDYPTTQLGAIRGRVTRLTGLRQPGRQVGDGEYEPPTLEQSHPQRLYRVWNDTAGYDVLVYPEDAEQVSR